MLRTAGGGEAPEAGEDGTAAAELRRAGRKLPAFREPTAVDWRRSRGRGCQRILGGRRRRRIPWGRGRGGAMEGGGRGG
jgi:hypothetical protein